VDIGKKMSKFANFTIEILKSIPIKNFGTVGDIGGAGNLQRRVGNWSTHRAAHVEAHHHDHAPHDTGHFIPDILQGIGPQHFIGQGADIFTFVGDVIGPVDDPALFVLEVIVDGMIRHGERRFFIVFKRQVTDKPAVNFRTGIDEN